MTDIWNATKAVNIVKHNIVPAVNVPDMYLGGTEEIFLFTMQACLLYAQYLYTPSNIQNVTNNVLCIMCYVQFIHNGFSCLLLVKDVRAVEAHG